MRRQGQGRGFSDSCTGNKKWLTGELTVAGVVCDPSREYLFSTLCKLAQVTSLEDSLINPDRTFAVFRPINIAFKCLPDKISDALSNAYLQRAVSLFNTISEQDARKTSLKMKINLL